MRLRTTRLAILGLVLSYGVAPGFTGELYVPADSKAVVARVPLSLSSGLRAWRGTERPVSLDRATRVVAGLIETSRRSGDARYLGQASTLLSPWLEQDPIPAKASLLYATVLQAQHRFDEALLVLDALLRLHPQQAQARLSQAVIFQAQGRPIDALESCRRLYRRVSGLTMATCVAGAIRLSSSASEVPDRLREAIANASERDAEVLPWSLRLYADIASQLGDRIGAEEALRGALSLDPEDTRTLTAYADLLLQSGQTKMVLRLVPAETDSPLLLLRRALAAQAAGSTETDLLRRRLEAYFVAETRREDSVHLREAGQAYLSLFGQPEVALRLALDNWKAQRELADARLVLAAALTAGDVESAQPVMHWIEQNGVVDARLEDLLRAIHRKEDRDAA